MNKLLYLFVVTTLFSCKSQSTYTPNNFENTDSVESTNILLDEENQGVLQINAEVTELLLQLKRTEDVSKRNKLLSEASKKLIIAFAMDSNVHYTYLNQSWLYREYGKYEKAAEILRALNKRKENPEALLLLGIIIEKTGSLDKAKIYYQKAYDSYAELLKTPSATARDHMNKEYALILLEGKEAVLQEIKKQLKGEPLNSELNVNKKILEEFDREEFLNSF